MLDEKGVARESDVSTLSGLPKGKQGRKTNWDIVSKLVGLSRIEHLAECRRVLERQAALPGELPAGAPFIEGAARQVLVNRYERDPGARRACIAHYGPACVVCGFSFAAVYGPLAEGFIHVHHLSSLAEIGGAYVVDPVADLRPVCPNCHAVIHLGGVTRKIEDVKQLVGQRHRAEPVVSPDAGRFSGLPHQDDS
ncbi:HNH endonuclease [Corallococcus exiguus]|nr:HNH endonuclease [Corallococcus exiguus]